MRLHISNASLNKRIETRRNLTLVLLLFLVTLFAAYHEKYLQLLSPYFVGVLLAAFLLTIWLARSVSSTRLISLILVIFMVEYIKESIGIESGIWVYHGFGELYIFGIWAWVLGGLTVYTLSTKILIKFIERLDFTAPSWLGVMMVLALAVLIVFTLGPYHSGAGLLYYSFYFFILIVAAFAAFKMGFKSFLGVVVTAWLVAYPSEYLGSVSSGVWTYPHNPEGPPLFLIVGCWPLEILAQYAISGYISGEPL